MNTMDINKIRVS